MTDRITSWLWRIRSMRTTVPTPAGSVDSRQSSSGLIATTMSPCLVRPWATKSYWLPARQATSVQAAPPLSIRLARERACSAPTPWETSGEVAMRARLPARVR